MSDLPPALIFPLAPDWNASIPQADVLDGTRTMIGILSAHLERREDDEFELLGSVEPKVLFAGAMTLLWTMIPSYAHAIDATMDSVLDILGRHYAGLSVYDS